MRLRSHRPGRTLPNPTFTIAVEGRVGVLMDEDDRSKYEGWDKPTAPPESWVYFVRARGTGLLKIGRTNNVAQRLNTLKTGCPVELILVGTIPGDYRMESVLAQRFRKHRVRGEWYSERILPDVLGLLAEEEAA